MTNNVSTMTNSVVTFFLLLLLAFSHRGWLPKTNPFGRRTISPCDGRWTTRPTRSSRRPQRCVEKRGARGRRRAARRGRSDRRYDEAAATAAAKQRALRRRKMDARFRPSSVVDEDVEFAPALPLGTSELLETHGPCPRHCPEGGGEQEGKEDNDDDGNDGTSGGSPVGRGFTGG